jgi:hypothetical protein
VDVFTLPRTLTCSRRISRHCAAGVRPDLLRKSRSVTCPFCHSDATAPPAGNEKKTLIKPHRAKGDRRGRVAVRRSPGLGRGCEGNITPAVTKGQDQPGDDEDGSTRHKEQSERGRVAEVQMSPGLETVASQSDAHDAPKVAHGPATTAETSHVVGERCHSCCHGRSLK